MNPAAVSHVLMKMEHRFTSLMELLHRVKKKKNSFKAARPVTEKKRFVLFIYITKFFVFFLHLTIVERKSG